MRMLTLVTMASVALLWPQACRATATTAAVTAAGHAHSSSNTWNQHQQQQQAPPPPPQQQLLPLPSMPASSQDCGKPYALCGLSIPKSVTCTHGPGWCQSGFYCALGKLSPESRCLPIPQDCGKVGKACCPSNTASPHTKQEDVFRQAFCTDSGAYCFSSSQLGVVKDFFKGNTGAYPCTYVAPDCGSAAGKPCCPLLYRQTTNPPLPHQGCWGSASSGSSGLYCSFDANALRGGAQQPFLAGTCVENEPNCGQFNQSCCVETTSSGNMLRCGAAATAGGGGQRGFCALAPQGGPDKKQICYPCPSPDVVKADPLKHLGC